MNAFRAIVISDIHLSAERPFFFHNWDVAVDWINREKPDLVLCCGDVALNAPSSPDDLTFAKAQLDRLHCPVYVVPGNHDVGNCRPDIRGEHVITDALRSAYLGLMGADRFSESFGNWTLIGIDALLCGSELAAEHDQFAWLDAELDRLSGQQVLLVMHKPLFRHAPEEDDLHQGSIYPAPRIALRGLLERHRVRRILSGHNHEFLHSIRHGFEFVWAPSTAFINDGDGVTRGGGKRIIGLLDLRFEPMGMRVEPVMFDDMLTIDIAGWLKDGIHLYEHHTSARFRRP